ncbi:titin isoform X3 [Photinus pyralis]|uniref:titin isoform X3 n=1 Tax=Photinus pyralis TaxID=7054 RepID=UPI001266FD8F|nr:titin isoform X3 [Photinus pyralis]
MEPSLLEESTLRDQVATLPGGKDKEGRPILLVTIPTEAAPADIGPSLRYLLSVFSSENQARDVTVVLDTRKGNWKTARSYIRQVNATLTTSELAQLIVVRPDAFWDKQRVENCTSTQTDGQINFTSPSRLIRFIDQPQLPSELGGSFIYNHSQWIENRLKADEYFRESAEVLKNLEEFHQRLLNNRLLRATEVVDAVNASNETAESLQELTEKNLEKGQELLKKIEHDNRNRKYASESDSMMTPQDILDTIRQIENTRSDLRKKQTEIEDAWKLMRKSFVGTKDLNLLIRGVVNVTNWILGPAENLLNSQRKVGHDVSSAEELRNAHEAIELRCWETYGAYAELLYKINNFPNDDSAGQVKDLIWQKDFMDFVCRSFATRMERRRNILITSLRFFRLVSEYFDRTSEVFESLVMGNKVDDFSAAKQKLDKLQASQISLDAMERELVKEGEKLSDMLSMPVKDALGRELALDYSEDIANIRDILDATNARKNLFSDSVELQKLTLEQVTHIDAYECDAKQAIQWLDELFQVMLQHHGHVGITTYEIQVQKDEHQTFQETAKDTYNYGCQLLNASLALRQSCKLPTQDHAILYQKLKSSWQRLLNVSQEQMTRLRVSAVFHRSVEEHCNQLRDLREAVATMPLEEMSKKQTRVRNFYTIREKLLVEVGRMVRLGKLLRSRLRESIYLNETLMESENSTDADKNLEVHDPSVQDNAVAVEAITEKLAEVTSLAEEMDQALLSAQQDCGLLTATSSTTTSASTTPTTVVCMSTKATFDDNSSYSEESLLPSKPLRTEDLKSDDEFLTASECTFPHSRSSSYNTASECENRYSPWWDYDKKDCKENVSKEKLVLGVGLPELPSAKSVLKPSPEVPPGKIVREVTETTHLKVQHSHSIGVSSYVLTSEVAREKDGGACSTSENFTCVDAGSLLERMRQCGDWLQLKILEVSPELTALGNNLAEAVELQQAHDEVLHQLQNKQSPVEELLRQADQLISTQKPRAEVYAAMAESLGKAWKDINSHLELRKQVLDLHVQYHTKADEFFSIVNSLESACADSVVPIQVESIKQYLTNIHDLRRSLLESLMSALKMGNLVLGKLHELGAEGTLDSRPDRIRCSVNRAISQVQNWLDQLHAKRQLIEITFSKRKAQLEQCLALAILASDLREVEDTLKEKRNILRNTDQLGDSSSSAELLQHEHKKLLPEASALQERALKITKATEQLVESGCFAGEKATEHAYSVLSSSSDYVSELEERSALLERVIAFFRKAQTALTKLDQLEIQIKTSELPSTSPQLAQLHEQCARTVEEITSSPIEEGYAILNAAKMRGTDGVKRMVEELENRKIAIDALCTAHREEKLRINQALNSFLEKQNELYAWLLSAAEAFLRGRQDMGSDLPMAKDFWDLHNHLLVDLQTKGNEINALLLTLPPVLEYLEDNQRRDVDSKVEELHQLWLKLKNILETRLDLSAIYVKFHTEADYVNREIDKLEHKLNNSPTDIDQEEVNKLEEKWESLIPLYQSAKNTGITFINATSKVSEPYLDTKRACMCVESVLEKLSARQLVVTRNWQTFHTTVVEKRELQMQLELNMTESTKTINWITKLDSQLYPVITTEASKPEAVSEFLEYKLKTVYPEVKRAQNEVEQRIKAVESLITKATVVDESTLNVKNKLLELNQKLAEVTTDYQILLQMLMTYFNNLADMDRTVEDLNSQCFTKPLSGDMGEVDTVILEQEGSRLAILEMFKYAQNDCDKLVSKINKQEPEGAAEHDISKLQHQIAIRKNNWEEMYGKRSSMLEAHRRYCQFNTDLNHINEAINELSHQLKELRGQYGESLSAAKATSQAFGYFEKTAEVLNQRIDTFIKEGRKLIEDGHIHSPHIDFQLGELQERWNALKKQIDDSRRLINLSIRYFTIVDEAMDWFKEGSHILVSIARRSTAVRKPEEAQMLLNEIEQFLKPGEAKQAERIATITSLASELYEPQITSRSSQVVIHNEEMLESFTSISRELQSLIVNLRAADEEKERARVEQEHADALLAAAKAEAEIARAAAEAAENARRVAEAEARRIADEEARRAAEAEARRLAEEQMRKLAEAEAKRLAEAETKRIAELEARRLAAEEAMRIVEAQSRAELEARRLAEEAAKRLAEAEAKRIAELEARRLAAEEAMRIAEAQRLAELEARRLAEEEAKRLAAIEAQKLAEAKRLAEEETRRLAELEARRLAAEEARRVAETQRLVEEETRRLAQEELLAQKMRILELEKPKEVTITQVEIPVKSVDVTDNVQEVMTQTIEVVKVTKVAHQTPVVETISSTTTIDGSGVWEAPTFILPLNDTVLQEGSKFTFICQVIGNPTPTVIWYKDGIAIGNNPDYQTSFKDGTCTLTIEETFTEDSAKYICKATNRLGTAETGALLTVKESHPPEELIPPKFVKHLEPAFTKQGQKFQFECLVEGHPLPTVQWFKNGECIDNCPDYGITYNNGEAILRFDEIHLDCQADYTCKATNQVGMAQTTANLCVEPWEKTENPFFTIPLSNVMARAGQKIKLECEVSGLPTPSLTWSHNGKPVKETRELKFQSEDNHHTLVISEAFPKDAGTYVATALNDVGESTSTCNVTVKGRLPTETSDSELASDMEPIKPSIQVPLKDISVFDGKTVQLDCVIVGQPEPEVIWYHNDKPVKESADFQLLFQGDRCSLIIQEAFAEDAGDYRVVALNSAGEASSKCTLTVTPLTDTAPKDTQEEKKVTGSPPKFNKLLSDVLASEEDRVVFEANVVGEPRPSVKWLLNNDDIELNQHYKLSYDEDGTVKLEIEKILPEDKGVYTVKASNSNGDAKCFAQLIVKSFKPTEAKEYEEIKTAPQFKELFSDRQAFEDTTIKFECIVSGKPTPKVKWLFNEEAVSGKAFLVSTSGERQVLTITNLTKENSGTITCIAENEVGKAICTATLSVKPGQTVMGEPKEVPAQELVDAASYSSKREVFVQSSTSSKSTVVTNSGTAEPDVQTHGYIAKDSQTIKQVNEQTPEVQESHFREEYHKVREPGVIQEHSMSTVQIGEASKIKETTVSASHLPVQRKTRPPKFTSPIVGKIVDQGVDVLLEGIIDGSPTPTVKWEKNGVPLVSGGKITVSYELNRVRVEIKDVGTSDGGRYTCTAVNEAGSAVSTSDLVVRKTVFPPVFGRRLQAQVVKKGDRVHMDVEVTGTPTPTVTWFKDDKPIKEVLLQPYKILVQGNSHTLIIENADFSHTGKYMVKAVNDGGEAQSIADFAVFEPTPDTMVEVVKTVVFEDVHKHETLAQAAEQSKKTYSAPQPKTVPIQISKPAPVSMISLRPSTPASYISTESHISESQSSAQAQYSTVTETTVSKESKTFKMESNTADFSPAPFHQIDHKETLIPTTIEKISIQPPQPESTGIETTSISKQSSLDYFVQKMKEHEEPVPKELPKGTPLQSDIYTKFEDTTKVDYHPPPIIKTSEKLIDHSFSSFHPQPSPFNLTPEPPPEICFTPKQDVYRSEHQEIRKHDYSYSKTQPVPMRPVSPRPSAEALEMEKLWTPHKEPDRTLLVSSPLPTRPISSLSEPSAEGRAMEKSWAHKSETHKHTWPEESKSWSAQTTLEKKWIPVHTKTESVYKESKVIPTPVMHYVAKVTDLHETGYATMESSSSEMHHENIVYEHSAKPSEIIKSWPPPSQVEEPKPAYKIETIPIRPASVQDITDEVYLQPGPPPEIGFAPAPSTPQFRSVPPPLPPKQEKPQPPPVPARPYKPVAPPKKSAPPPMLFTPAAPKPQLVKPGPPPTPSKFARGRFTDSDYESDLDTSRMAVRWKPSTSDNEEPAYRHVNAPKFTVRSKSVEPPFERPFYTQPPVFTSSVSVEDKELRKQRTSFIRKQFEQKREVSPPLLKPGTPPEYVQSEVKYMPESPKVKPKSSADGYMADTDEPFTLRKKISKFEHRQDETLRQEFYSTSSESSRQKMTYESQSINKPTTPKVYRKHTPASSAQKKELVATPIITSVSTKSKTIYKSDRDSSLEPFPYKPDPPKPKQPKAPPPPSPSKFVKGEFRESDYESDYEGRMSSVWGGGDRCYKPVRPVLTPSGRHSQTGARSPTPPTEFDQPPHFSGPPRPKFEPIEKPVAATKLSETLSQKSSISQVVHKPKPVTPKSAPGIELIVAKPAVPKPGTPPEIGFAPKTTQYYRSTTSAPYQNAVQTETSNVMHFKESTETSHRTVSLEQTRKVITFGKDKKQRVPPPATPTKFVKGEMRESDYDSEIENTRIKSVWVPGEGDNDLPGYRKVVPPSKHFIKPVKNERIISPMEFDTQPPVMNSHSKNVQPLKPGPPPQYSYSPATVTKIASKNMENMTHTFKSKAQKFVSDIMTDVNKKSTEDSPQVYREETRAAQHGIRSAEYHSSAPTTPVNREQNTAHPKRPPMIITPLRDIAVVSGQSARFECIVQSESTPSVLWSKNGRIIQNSKDLQIHYRNGVCRLTIPTAYPEDAGSYTCTASNQIGAVGTTATLQVPGERRSQYIK